MSLEVYYPSDIRNALLALASAGERNGPEYHKALHDVALAFGINPPLAWRVVDSNIVEIANETTHVLHGAKTAEAAEGV